MKHLFILLLMTTSWLAYSSDTEQSVLIKKIQEQAAGIDLHERHFIRATQALSQHQLRAEEATTPIPNQFLEYTTKNGQSFWKREIKNNQDQSFTSDELKIRAMPTLLGQLNNLFVNHANALGISVIDLPRLYQLKDDPNFAELFRSTSSIAEQSKMISSVTIEIQCSSIEQDCKRELKRSEPEHIANLWQQAGKAEVLDNQSFVLRYINPEGEQIGHQEVWRYHEHFGPRFFEVME